jgi:hypothetical protein
MASHSGVLVPRIQDQTYNIKNYREFGDNPEAQAGTINEWKWLICSRASGNIQTPAVSWNLPETEC